MSDKEAWKAAKEEMRRVKQEWKEQARRAKDESRRAREEAQRARRQGPGGAQARARAQAQGGDPAHRPPCPGTVCRTTSRAATGRPGCARGLTELAKEFGEFGKDYGKGFGRDWNAGRPADEAPRSAPSPDPHYTSAPEDFPAEYEPSWVHETPTGDPVRDLERLLDRFRDDIRDAARDHGVTPPPNSGEARRHLSTAAAHIAAPSSTPAPLTPPSRVNVGDHPDGHGRTGEAEEAALRVAQVQIDQGLDKEQGHGPTAHPPADRARRAGAGHTPGSGPAEPQDGQLPADRAGWTGGHPRRPRTSHRGPPAPPHHPGAPVNASSRCSFPICRSRRPSATRSDLSSTPWPPVRRPADAPAVGRPAPSGP